MGEQFFTESKLGETLRGEGGVKPVDSKKM